MPPYTRWMPHPAPIEDDLAEQVSNLVARFGLRRTVALLASSRTVVERATARQHLRTGSRLQLRQGLDRLTTTTAEGTS